MRQILITKKSAKLRYCLFWLFAGMSACTGVSARPPGSCQIVDLKNDAPAPFSQINPQNFGDLVKLAREYPERKLLWCDDGQITPYVN
ncbi:MAG: hypothetical protein CMD92_10220 [Gammaproteobacteria bacterium]|nr:hypothetical protein [Gammaproteobacteria bacterium]